MSLKALHVVFIVASIVLALGFGAWSLNEYFAGEPKVNLYFGIGSLISGLGLIFYCRAVLRKMKDISYL
jgi:hypothetical protein